MRQRPIRTQRGPSSAVGWAGLPGGYAFGREGAERLRGANQLPPLLHLGQDVGVQEAGHPQLSTNQKAEHQVKQHQQQISFQLHRTAERESRAIGTRGPVPHQNQRSGWARRSHLSPATTLTSSWIEFPAAVGSAAPPSLRVLYVLLVKDMTDPDRGSDSARRTEASLGFLRISALQLADDITGCGEAPVRAEEGLLVLVLFCKNPNRTPSGPVRFCLTEPQLSSAAGWVSLTRGVLLVPAHLNPPPLLPPTETGGLV